MEQVVLDKHTNRAHVSYQFRTRSNSDKYDKMHRLISWSHAKVLYPCSRMHQLPNSATACVRADWAMGKNNTTYFIDTRVTTTWVDKLTIVGAMFIKKNLHDFLGGTEKFSLSFSKRLYRLSSKCLEAKKSTGKENSRPTAMRLQDKSVPWIGAEFHTYKESSHPKATRTGHLSLKMIWRPLLK